MIMLKKSIAFVIIVASLALTLFLTSCDITDWFKDDVEAAMDDILTGDNYTMEHKSVSDAYTTLKVAEGEMHIIYQAGDQKVEHYLFCDEEKNAYYYAKIDATGTTKVKLDKNTYLMQYFTAFYTESKSDRIFDYRHILEMADPVSDNRYEYSKESYSEKLTSKTEYSIEFEDDKLVLLQVSTKSTQTSEGPLSESQSVKTTFSLIGNTEIEIPSKVLSAESTTDADKIVISGGILG